MILFPYSATSDLETSGLLSNLGAISSIDTLFQRSDVHPALLGSVALRDQVVGIPLDGSQLLLYVRSDMLAAGGLPVPDTWEQLLQVASLLNGTDISMLVAGPPVANSTRPSYSAASRPVYGFCLPPSQQQLAHLALAVLAPMVQTDGSTQGMYLNADTLRPAATTAAMPYVLSYLRRLAAYSAPVAFSARAPQFSNDFALGRCAMTVGTAAQFRRNSHAAHPAGPSAVIGKVTAALLPGSDVVLSADGRRLISCTPSLCPHAQPSGSAAVISRALQGAAAGHARLRLLQADALSVALRNDEGLQDRARELQQQAESAAGTTTADGVLVNQAPLLSPDGLVAGLDRESETMAQLYGWSFLSSLGGPTVSWQMLLLPSSEVGPWRVSHMDPAAALPRWAAGGYQAADTASFLAAARTTLAHSNLVKPMRVRTAVQYGRAVAVAAEAAATLPAYGPVAGETAAEAATATSAAVAALTEAMGDLYGRTGPYGANFMSELVDEYKAALGVHSKPAPTPTASSDTGSEGSSSNTGSVVGIAVGVSVAAVAALSLLGFLLCHRRLRLRGDRGGAAEVDEWMVVPAPQAGPATCIAVTDIEGSTSLWETLPEAVMDQALRIHHHVVRTVSVRHGGYESATASDSFILVFATATDAAQFALRLQEALLLEASWPQTLLEAAPCRPVYVIQDDALAAAHKVSLVPAAPARQPIRRGAAGLVVGRMASMTLGRPTPGSGPGAGGMGTSGAMPSGGRFGGGGARSSATGGPTYAGMKASGGLGGAAGVYGRQNTWQGHAGAIMELTGNMPPPPKEPKGPPRPVAPPSTSMSNVYRQLPSPLHGTSGRGWAAAFSSHAPGVSSEKGSSLAAGHLHTMAKTLLAMRASVRSSFVGTFRRGGHASSQHASTGDITEQHLHTVGSGVVLQTTSTQHQHHPGSTEPSPSVGAAAGRGSRQGRTATAQPQSANLFGSGNLFGPGSDAHSGWLKALGSVAPLSQAKPQALGSEGSVTTAPAIGNHSGDSGDAAVRGFSPVAGARGRSGARRASLTSWLMGSRASAHQHAVAARSDGRDARSSCSGHAAETPLQKALLLEVPMLQEPPSPPRSQPSPQQGRQAGRAAPRLPVPDEAAAAAETEEANARQGRASDGKHESCTLQTVQGEGMASQLQQALPVAQHSSSPQSLTTEAPSKAHAFLAALGLVGDRSARGRVAGTSRLGPGGAGGSIAGHQSAAQVVLPAADSLLSSAAAAAAASFMLSGPPQTSSAGAVAFHNDAAATGAQGRATQTALAAGGGDNAACGAASGAIWATVGGGRLDFEPSGGLPLPRHVAGALSRPGAAEVELEEEAAASGSLPLAKMLIAARQTSMRVTDFMMDLQAGGSRQQLPSTPRGSHAQIALSSAAAGSAHSTRLPSSSCLNMHPGASAPVPHSTRLPTRPRLDLATVALAQGSGPSDAGRTGTDASGTVDFMDTAARHGWMLGMPSTVPPTDHGTSTVSHQFNACVGTGSTYSAGGPAASPKATGSACAGRRPAGGRSALPVGLSAPQLEVRSPSDNGATAGFASPLGSTVAALPSVSVPQASGSAATTAAAAGMLSSGDGADRASAAVSSGGGDSGPYAAGERLQRMNGGGAGSGGTSPGASSGTGRRLPSVSPLARMTGSHPGNGVNSGSGQLPFLPSMEDMPHFMVVQQDGHGGSLAAPPQLQSSGSLPASRRPGGAMLSTIVDGDEHISSVNAITSGPGGMVGSSGGGPPQPPHQAHGEQQQQHAPWWRRQKLQRALSSSQRQLQLRNDWLVPVASDRSPNGGMPRVEAASEGLDFPLCGRLRSDGKQTSNTTVVAGHEAAVTRSSNALRTGSTAFASPSLLMPALLQGSIAGRLRHGQQVADGGYDAAAASMAMPGAGDVDSDGSGGGHAGAGPTTGGRTPSGMQGRPSRAALHERFAELAAETAPHSSRLAAVSTSLSFFRLGGMRSSSQRSVQAASPRGKQPGGSLQEQIQVLLQERQQEQATSIKDGVGGVAAWGKSGSLLRGLPLPSLGAFLKSGRNPVTGSAHTRTTGSATAGQELSGTDMSTAAAAAVVIRLAGSTSGAGGPAQLSSAHTSSPHGAPQHYAHSMALPRTPTPTPMPPEAEGTVRRTPSTPSQRPSARAASTVGAGGTTSRASTTNGIMFATTTRDSEDQDMDGAASGGYLDSHLLHTSRNKSRLSPLPSPSGGSVNATATGLEQSLQPPSPPAGAGAESFTARALLFAAGASAVADANASAADSPLLVYGITIGTENTSNSVMGASNLPGSTQGAQGRSTATPPPDNSCSGATAGLYRLLSGGQGQCGAAPTVPAGLPSIAPEAAAATTSLAGAMGSIPAKVGGSALAPVRSPAAEVDLLGAQDAWLFPTMPSCDAGLQSAAAVVSVGAAAVAAAHSPFNPASSFPELQPELGSGGGPPAGISRAGGGSKLMDFFRQAGAAAAGQQFAPPLWPAPPSRADQISEALPMPSLAAYMSERSEIHSYPTQMQTDVTAGMPLTSKASDGDAIRSSAAEGAIVSPGGGGRLAATPTSGALPGSLLAFLREVYQVVKEAKRSIEADRRDSQQRRRNKVLQHLVQHHNPWAPEEDAADGDEYDGHDGQKRKLVFAGLRVRVGLHCGVTDARDIQYNAATARMTFGGEGLRIAKAVCDCASGGQVVMSGEVLFQIQVAGGLDQQASLGDGPRMMLDLGDHQLLENISPSYAPAVPGAYNHQRTALALMQQSVRPSAPEVTEGGGADMLLATHRSIHTAVEDKPAAVPVTRHLLALTSPALLGRLLLMPPVRSALHQYTPGFMDAPVGETVTVVVFRVSNAASLLAWSTATAAESMAILELYLRASLGPLLKKAAAGGGPPLACYLAAAPPGSPFGTFVAGFSQPAAAARWALTAAGRMAELPWPAELLESQWGRPLEEVTRAEAEAADTRAVARRGRMSSAGSAGMLRSDSSEAALQAVAAAAAAAAAGGGASVSSSRRGNPFRRASPPASVSPVATPERGRLLKSGRSRSRVELPAVLDDDAAPDGAERRAGRSRAALALAPAESAVSTGAERGGSPRANSDMIVMCDDASGTGVGGAAASANCRAAGGGSSSIALNTVGSDITFGMQARSFLPTGDGARGPPTAAAPLQGTGVAGSAGSGSASFFAGTTASANVRAAIMAEQPSLPHIELLESHGGLIPLQEDSQPASAMELMLLPQHAIHASHLPASTSGTSMFASDLKAGGLTSGPEGAGAAAAGDYGTSPGGRASIVQLSMPQGVLGVVTTDGGTSGTDPAAAVMETHARSDGGGMGVALVASSGGAARVPSATNASMASLRMLLLGRGSGKRLQGSVTAGGGAARHNATKAAEAVDVRHGPTCIQQPVDCNAPGSGGNGTAGTGVLSTALSYDCCSSSVALPEAARYTSSAANTHSAAAMHRVAPPSPGGATYSLLQRKSATAAAGGAAASLPCSGGGEAPAAAASVASSGGQTGATLPAAESSIGSGGRSLAGPGARPRTAPIGPSSSAKRLLLSVSKVAALPAARTVGGAAGGANSSAAAAARARAAASGLPLVRMREDVSSIYSAEGQGGATAEAGSSMAVDPGDADAFADAASAAVGANGSAGGALLPSSAGGSAGASAGGSALARYVSGGLRQTALSAINASLSFVGQRLHSGTARVVVASAVQTGPQPVSKSGMEASWSSRSGRSRLLRAIAPESPADVKKRSMSKSNLALATADEAAIAAAAAAAAAAEAAATAAAAARAEEDAEVVSFRGLRVRLGMAVGPVRVELCPLTGRVVYSGKTVTVAMTAAASARLGTLYMTEHAASLIREAEDGGVSTAAGDMGGAAAGTSIWPGRGTPDGHASSQGALATMTGTGQQQPLLCTPAPPMTVAGSAGATPALLVNGKNVPFRCRLKPPPVPPLDEQEQPFEENHQDQLETKDAGGEEALSP
ncbi:hypothetical protein HYH02_009068 [Chlamydomonas schloesseri]|uniref:Guanylate cyclase domain-containing protein n=1 Tax=Chlamydomonas schloesseri TaxID=2026947 RepID=A0A836B0Y3_9CHLO|nr:hypothetical protein HYH02_009068 [Chlamydomonas schloesseri]|eukprot:KAG2444128.1 hypothetical protein HYH02_009068 [Chlamydomonas schloesseri]